MTSRQTCQREPDRGLGRARPPRQALLLSPAADDAVLALWCEPSVKCFCLPDCCRDFIRNIRSFSALSLALRLTRNNMRKEKTQHTRPTAPPKA